MTTIRNLNVAVTARTTKFSKGMQSAESRLSRFGGAVRRIGRSLTTLGGIASGVSLVGFAYLVKRTADGIDSMAKLSDRIGIATEDLAGLQHAATITGAGTQTLDKGLQFLAKSLGEARTGVGEARQALDVLGLSVKDFDGLDASQKFDKIADAVAGLATQEDKAYVASKLFGRAGVALVNTLELGSDGLRKMKEEARLLGITFTRSEAAGVERANDALTRMGALLKGLFRRITIELAPVVERLTTKLVMWATSGEGVAAKVSRIFEQMTLGVVRLAAALDDLQLTALKVERAVVSADFWTSPMFTEAQFQKALPLLERMTELDAKIGEIERGTGEAEASVRRFFASIREEAEKAAKPVKDLADQVPALARLFGAFVPIASRAGGGVIPAPQDIGKLDFPKNLRNRRETYLRRFGLDSIEKLGGAFSGENLEQFTPGADIEKTIAPINEFAARSSQILQGALSDAITDGIFDGFRNAQDILEGFGRAITQTIIDAFITATLEQRAVSFFSRIFNPISTLGGTAP